jgi:hypothetical protein
MPRTVPHTPALPATSKLGGASNRSLRRLVCATFGHRVDNRAFARTAGAQKRCPCGAAILGEARVETRVSHTLSCFFFGHHYSNVGVRDGHWEYVCDVCGHPLLFEAGRSPYAGKDAFRKQVRYLCGLLGHRVHTVTLRCGFTEYACHCGHTFLGEEPGRATVRHPLVCVVAGHYVSLVERRAGHGEYRCRNCGHTFCFVATV